MIEASRHHAMAPNLRYVINQVPRQKCLIILVIGILILKKGLTKFNPQDSHALKRVIIEIFRESACTE